MKTTQTEPAERVLIEAAQKDPSRFDALYELHFYRVYAYVVRRVGNRDTAEDLTAEVFQQALANLGKYEWRGVPFAAWLYRIAANAITDRWTRASRESGDPPPDRPGHTDVSIVEVEERAEVFRAVSALPDDQRRVVELRFAEEKSIREAAEALGRTEGAVKQLQYRAIENLRALLGGKGHKKAVETHG